MDRQSPIRLIVFDIDGVLTEGEAHQLDLPLLDTLANMNRIARQQPGNAAVTLCSGRPAPYVECMLQAIGGHHPAIFENGAGLYVPDGYRFLAHPDVIPHSMGAIRQCLAETLVRSNFAFLQPGKEFTLSLFASDPADTPRLYDRAADALGALHQAVDLVYSSSCLNVLPRGINKGRGIEFLAAQTGIPPDSMLGIGDSDVDLPFLAAVGLSAAPNNANEPVKACVQYVSPYRTADGVRNILRHFGLIFDTNHTNGHED
jgi:HAD superfamily hydrolase (TIGR01484 family)